MSVSRATSAADVVHARNRSRGVRSSPVPTVVIGSTYRPATDGKRRPGSDQVGGRGAPGGGRGQVGLDRIHRALPPPRLAALGQGRDGVVVRVAAVEGRLVAALDAGPVVLGPVADAALTVVL